jgi:serine/threonine-protein kinase
MLAGAPPFQGSVQSIMSGHLFKPPPAIVESEATIPPAVEQVIQTALRKAPTDRFDSASDFAAHLAAALAGDEGSHPEPLTGAITTPIKLDSLSGPEAEVDADEMPTFVDGFSPDEMETYGKPNQISTADIVPPAPADATGPVTESVPVPAIVRERARALPAVAAALGVLVVAGLVFAVSSHTAAPVGVEATMPPAPPAAAYAPRAEPAAAPAAAEPETADASPAAPRATTAAAPRSDRSAAAPPKTKTDQKDDAKADTKDDQKVAQNDKDKGKKKRKWYNPFSW